MGFVGRAGRQLRWLGSTRWLHAGAQAQAKELLFPFLLRSLQGFLAL